MKHVLSPKRLGRLLLECLLGCVGVIGAILCLTTTYGIPTPRLLFAAVPLLMLLVCFLSKFKRGDLFCAIVGGLLLLLALILLKPLARSARNLWNILGWNFAQGYEVLKDYFPPDLALNYRGTRAILLLLAAVETIFVGLSVSRWRRTWPVILTLLLGILPCFVLTNTLPHLIPLMMVIGSILVQVLSQNSRRREPRDTGKAVLWGTVVAGLLLGALLILVPRDTYEPPITWRQLTEKLEHWEAIRDNRGNEAAGLTGNPDSVVLSDLRSLPNRRMEVMEIRTDYQGRIYLRGSAYDRFDGSRWSRTGGRDWDLATVYPTVGTGAMPSHFLEITPITGETLYYTAYEPLSLPAGAVLTSDAYLKNNSPMDTYALAFSPDAQGPAASQAYIDYVNQTCLELSPESKENLRAWFVAHAGEGSLLLAVPNRAELISDIVSRVAEYSRQSSLPPAGEDFALWFLTEAETGYCVHYATTAAALLRAVDIPARYVSGYICTPGKDGTAKVSTLQAHAWVEYFYEGRWHRLEPTPGSATEFTGNTTPWTGPETVPTETVYVTTEPIVTAAPTDPVTPEVETEPFVKPTRPTEPTLPSEEPSSEEPSASQETPSSEPVTPETPGTPKEPWHMPIWGWILLGVAGFLGLVWLRRYLVSRARERKLRRAQGNHRAMLLFYRYRKLCRILKAPVDEEMLALAKKATFSQHTLAPEELERMGRAVEETAAALNGSGFWKRICYRYILSVI